MKPSLRFWLTILVLAFITLSGCQIGFTPAPVPTPTSLPTLIPPAATLPVPTSPGLAPDNATVTPDLSISSPEALAACDLALQSAAMNPSHIPDWEKLKIDTCYQLALQLDASVSRFSGTAAITYTNLEAQPLPDLVLRTYPNSPDLFGGSLQIDSASIDGAAITPEPLPDSLTAIRIPLAQPLEPGQTLFLELTYSGTIPVDFPTSTTYGIFNLSTQGPLVALANAYPMLAFRENGAWRVDPVFAEGDAVIGKTALFRVNLTLPEGWLAAATGQLLNTTTANGQVTYSYASGPVREFAIVASPAFQLKTAQVDGITIQHWGLPFTEISWEEALKVTATSLNLFNEVFGPYPFQELDVVAVPLNNASGVEYPGIILMLQTLYTDQTAPRLLPTVLAHEVSHQWWYAGVGNDVLLEPWQDEGLATFSAQFYQLKFNRPFYDGTRAFYEQRVKEQQAAEGEEAVGLPVSAFTGRGRAYAAIVYYKGYLFFEAVREQIGDEAFFTALNRYYSARQYQFATPSDLLGAFEQSCACELDGLYNQWGVP